MPATASKTMKAVQVARKGGAFEVVERDLPAPGPRQVRIKVEACGVCHSDLLTKEGYWPGVQYPRCPGHEVAGRIDAVGPDAAPWKVGDRAGLGWHGSHCFTCEACRRGDFMLCANGRITGIHFDGGYASFVVVGAEAVARIPDGLPSEEAAPLMCAGVTVFNALRHSGARPGDLVAVQGIGGLGHLGVQFAQRMGFETVAIGRGKDKEPLARKLGAKHFVDSTGGDWPAELQKLGGARVALATAPDAKSMAALAGGLGDNGTLLVVGAPGEPLALNATTMIGRRQSLKAWASGVATDSEDTMRFALLSGVHPMIETFPLERAAEAYERMLSGKVRFRSVLLAKA